MPQSRLLDLFDQEQRIDIEFPGMRKETTPHLTRFIRPAPGRSFVLYSRLDEPNADRIIQGEIAYFERLGLPFEWKVYDHDRPADLKDRLLAHGFVADPRDGVLVLDLAQGTALPAPAEVDLRRIHNRAGLQPVIQVEEQVWGENFGWIDERLGADLQVPGYLDVYVAWDEGQPASAGWVYFHPRSQFASLWGGATVPRSRRKGLYRAVLAARAQAARERGYRYLTIDANPVSQPILEGLGFEPLTYAHGCIWETRGRSRRRRRSQR